MTAKHNVIELKSSEMHDAMVQKRPVCVLNFSASWHLPCNDMDSVFEELSRKHPAIAFLKVEAEDVPEVSEAYEIATVPTFVVVKQGKAADRIEGANAPALTSVVEKHSKALGSLIPQSVRAMNGEQPVVSMESKLKQLVSSHPVMLFMKGIPSEPRCGFSRQTVELLNQVGCAYGSFDILSDEPVRQALKTFSNWPTYPQIYVNGELVGGLDILKEMIASGGFQKMVQTEDLEARLQKLVSSHPVMLFMKGDRVTPKCGFSRQIVQLLNDQPGLDYETFDILEDEEVRQGLKEFSNWPTFPQLYIKGELVGGLDIVRDLIAQNEFTSLIV